MEAGTRMGQGQGWGYKNWTLWQDWSLVLDKLEHLNKTLSLQKCKVAFLPQKSPWSPALLSPFTCQHLPICHDRTVMQTLPMPESPQHRLTMGINPSIFIHKWAGEILLLYLVSKCGQTLLLHIHTHPPTPVLFTIVQHSHFFLEGNQKPQSAPVSRTWEIPFLKCSSLTTAIQLPVLFRALLVTGFLHRCQRSEVKV